jgi:hypothetical protein
MKVQDDTICRGLRRGCVLMLLVTTVLITACQPIGANAEPTIALTNGTLIDGTGAAPVPDAVVIIQGDKISAAGASDQIAIPGKCARDRRAGSDHLARLYQWTRP